MQTKFQSKTSISKQVSKETLLHPRFYTTDFNEMARLDISSNCSDFEALLEEFRADYNRQHFIRGQEFEESWKNIDSESKKLFTEFLERSCTAEFSGFLLYKELSRRLKSSNPVIAECFLLMSRDEARHAGFLNKAMGDFNLSLDLGFLTKSRKYTFFSPKFIFYATYLSEKIGYWRYITIYRHLEQHREYRTYPIFKFFENWCQDENRHGDFFAALLKSQPKLLTTLSAKIWCKFFLVTVFITMYLNDCLRPGFYKMIGLDARHFDMHVIRKTNESASRIFPIALNTDHPYFFKEMDICAAKNQSLIRLDNKYNSRYIRVLNKIPVYISLISGILRLYWIPSIQSNQLN